MFVLVMDYLSGYIKLNTANPNFNFYPKCKKIILTHLSFVDDIVLFSRGDIDYVSILFHTLQQFSCYSGLELNLAKSNLFVAGVMEADLLVM